MTIGPSSRDYYDKYPAVENTPGDIWVDLPTLGLLPIAHLPGLVVTGACDLANRKVETVTYLPILPVRSWFSIVAALPDLRRLIDGQWECLNKGPLIEWPTGFRLPSAEELAAAETRMNEVRQGLSAAKHVTAFMRAAAGMRVIKLVVSPVVIEADDSDLRLLFGAREWTKTLERFARNSSRTDLHFLPSDEQPSEWSAIQTHSVVLFRYPITVPIEILEAAQDVNMGDWHACLASLQETYPMAAAFKARRPMKRVTLKTPFISDLLSRYVGINFRLGSPDFTKDAIERMCKEIQNSQCNI